MNMIDHLPVLQVVVPLLSAPLAVLLRPHSLAWAATTAASLMAFIIAVTMAIGALNGEVYTYAVGGWPTPYGIGLQVDSLSALMLLIVTGASTLALLVGYQSLNSQIDGQRQPLFYAAWLLSLSGLVGIAVSADAFNVFVFMEISALSSYVLLAGGPDRRALPSVFKYLVMGTIGATFYLIGVGLIYMMTGTLNLADIAARIHSVSAVSPVLIAAGFITVGLALKAAIFPLHAWLPNGYTYAPHAVTVFLAASSTKVALYVLFRFDFIVFQTNFDDHDIQFGHFLMPLAVLGVLVGSGAAIFQQNLKRLLAYSSVAQIGYIVLGVSLVSAAGITAGALHMFNHALAKGALFMAVACLAIRFNSVGIEQLSGASKKMPWTMAAFVLASLSLIGVPGTAGFISKWFLITAVLEMGSLGIALTVVIVISSLMAVVYIWRVIEVTYFRPALNSDLSVSEAPLLMLLATWFAAIANIYFGLNSEIPSNLASDAASLLMSVAP